MVNLFFLSKNFPFGMMTQINFHPLYCRQLARGATRPINSSTHMKKVRTSRRHHRYLHFIFGSFSRASARRYYGVQINSSRKSGKRECEECSAITAHWQRRPLYMFRGGKRAGCDAGAWCAAEPAAHRALPAPHPRNPTCSRRQPPTRLTPLSSLATHHDHQATGEMRIHKKRYWFIYIHL